MLGRVTQYLGLPFGSVKLDARGRKLCDMKPMWAALFPELTSRHDYIGYSDHDILLGDVASEVSALQAEDEVLTPMAWFPQPITNGNLLLVKTSPKMVHAFRRSPAWRAALQQEAIWVFDEHWGSSGPGMHHVYHAMLLNGELRVRPTSRPLVQDIVFMRGKRHKGLYPTIASYGAKATVTWQGGRLVASREGPCVCSAQVWDNVDIGSCAECLTQPDKVHTAITVRRTVEVLGFHFQVFKMAWRQKSRRPGQLEDFVPPHGSCSWGNATKVVIEQASGIRCAVG